MKKKAFKDVDKKDPNQIMDEVNMECEELLHSLLDQYTLDPSEPLIMKIIKKK
jgi:hypothetical protein